MSRSLLLIAALSSISAHRSPGYAGSTPVGLDGAVAFAHFDCARINRDPRRSRLRVPLPADCRLSIESPNGRSVVETEPASDGTATLRTKDGLRVAGLDQPTVLLWNPDSSGFLLNGGEGSGQVSHFRYFYRTPAGWRQSGRLNTSASRLYRRRFDCRDGPDAYTNSSGWDWTPSGLLRVIVQEGVHSRGCLQPHADRNVMFEVIGNPITGRIASAREISTLP